MFFYKRTFFGKPIKRKIYSLNLFYEESLGFIKKPLRKKWLNCVYIQKHLKNLSLCFNILSKPRFWIQNGKFSKFRKNDLKFKRNEVMSLLYSFLSDA